MSGIALIVIVVAACSGPISAALPVGSSGTGLDGGERIVLEGRQNVRPGSTVIERPREPGDGRGGKGGGKPDMAMAGGNDASKLPQALTGVAAWVADKA